MNAILALKLNIECYFINKANRVKRTLMLNLIINKIKEILYHLWHCVGSRSIHLQIWKFIGVVTWLLNYIVLTNIISLLLYYNNECGSAYTYLRRQPHEILEWTIGYTFNGHEKTPIEDHWRANSVSDQLNHSVSDQLNLPSVRF